MERVVPPAEPQDCLIVATEAFARLKTTAYWARIAGFTITKNGEEVRGHAVAFHQPNATSNVFMYDKSGSYDLDTRSHDLAAITKALNQLVRTGYRVQSPKWVGEGTLSVTNKYKDLFDAPDNLP